ncbi:hypothetical protein BJV82DRAFT_602989 [Fennellomyces sp. T-0311]|nr:hypothetical protein BJV82DRAFT_602989 [Fennellomyces sp. T-0311]
MNQRLHMRVTLALLLLLLVGVNGQASRDNPFIWQVIVEYDIGRSNQTQRYVSDTSVKLYSQDFQTVSPHNDLYGHNERLLLDFGDGCPQTTINDVQQLNGNTATSPSMMSQPSIALIQRGGRCDLWSDKINHTQSLSEAFELNIGAALLYDNMTYDASGFVQLNTENGSYPTWSSPLPASRDIRNMTDNDIISSVSNVFIAVYFSPNHYGRVLLDMIRQYTTTPTTDLKQHYVQLTMFFSETTFSVDDGRDNDGDRSDIWSVFTGERGYLAYLIAAGAALILGIVRVCSKLCKKSSLCLLNPVYLGVVLLRWCRTPRTADVQDRELEAAEAGIQMHQTGQTTSDRRRKMPLLKLNEMCPVQSLTGEIQTKNSVCAICLEELQEGDPVRILPCGHGFCVACIDVWLTKKSCLCPICKYDCDPVGEESSSDDDQPRSSVDLGDPHASETHVNRSPETAADSSNSPSSSPPPAANNTTTSPSATTNATAPSNTTNT